MDRITGNLLRQFAKEYTLEALPEDKQFEHFSAFATVRRHYSRSFSTEDIVFGGGGDTSIDAIVSRQARDTFSETGRRTVRGHLARSTVGSFGAAKAAWRLLPNGSGQCPLSTHFGH